MTARTKTFPAPYPRTRTNSLGPYTVGGGSTFLRQWYTNTGQETARSGPYQASFGQSESMYDVVTPGFAQRRASGEIVNNPMSKVSIRKSGTGDDGWRFDKLADQFGWELTSDTRVHWNDPTTAGADIINVSNLVRNAQTQALAGVQAATVQSMVTIGEGVKTLRMIVSPLRGLQQLLKDSERAYIRDLQRYGNPLNSVMRIKGHKRRARALKAWKERNAAIKQRKHSVRELEFIPDMVLAYNLGWKPLLNDVDALLHQIPALQYEERRTSRATARDEHEISTNESVSPGNGCLLHYEQTRKQQVTVRAGVLYADDFEASHHFGTRLKDVPEAVWELIPFSFLADYVVNLGDFVNAMTKPIGVRILAYYTTIMTSTTVKRRFVSGQGAGEWTVVRQPFASDEVTLVAKSRDNGAFTASLAHKLTWNLAARPPAQLQNALSLLTKSLFGTLKGSPFR